MVKKFVVHTGWKLKPDVGAFLLLTKGNKSTEEEIFELIAGKNLNLRIADSNQRFCVGFNNHFGERIPCPKGTRITSPAIHCQDCTVSEFYLCRAICSGEFCNPSSEEAKEYCWRRKVSVYLTYVGGKVKVGSSMNPLRRWLEQGSDAGVCIAEGVGLAPRALEHQINRKLGYSMAVRTKRKMNYLGKSLDKQSIKTKLESVIDEICSSISSEILLPRKELSEITFLDEFHGEIPKLDVRPLVKGISQNDLELGGEIVGVKGMIIVLKDDKTYYASNLRSLIGQFVELSEKPFEKKGQRSLFEFVK